MIASMDSWQAEILRYLCSCTLLICSVSDQALIYRAQMHVFAQRCVFEPLCVCVFVCAATLQWCSCDSEIRSSDCQSVLKASLCSLYRLPVALKTSFLTVSRAWIRMWLHPSLDTLLTAAAVRTFHHMK